MLSVLAAKLGAFKLASPVAICYFAEWTKRERIYLSRFRTPSYDHKIIAGKYPFNPEFLVY